MSNELKSTQRPVVLIIGAAGRTGLECVRHLAEHPSCPEIHAFCQNPSQLSSSYWDLCTSIVEGSARHAIDIEDALRETNATWVVHCVGTGDDVSPNNVRTFTAENLTRVLQKEEFASVQVIAVSMVRSIHLIGMVNKYRLRHVLLDHAGQEKAINALGHRATLVRPTLFHECADNDSILSIHSTKMKRRRSPSVSSESSQSSTSSNTSSTTTASSSFARSLARSGCFRRSKDAIGPVITMHKSSIVVLNDNSHAEYRNTRRSDLARWIVHRICDGETRQDTFDQYNPSTHKHAHLVTVTSKLISLL